MNGLLSPKDIQSEQALTELEKRLKLVASHVKKARRVKTPKHQVEVQKGTGYQYASAAYMIDQMDNFHPLRKEEGSVSINDKTACILAVVTVTDLITGESRVGTDAHRITFKKDSEKGLESLVDIGNDAKSALSEAIRNAYSRFGIAADIYKKVMKEPVTEEQRVKLEEILSSIPPATGLQAAQRIEYIKKQRETFNELDKNSAEEFLVKLATKINERIANDRPSDL